MKSALRLKHKFSMLQVFNLELCWGKLKTCEAHISRPFKRTQVKNLPCLYSKLKT